MTLTFPMFNIFSLQTLGRATNRQAVASKDMNSDIDDPDLQRALLHELMFHSPGAVQSDLGLAELLSQHPRQF